MTVETVLDVFIDANILLLVTCLVWSTVLAISPRIGLKSNFQSQLLFLNGSIGAIFLSPIVVYFFGGWASQNSLNISDMIVAGYLNGNFKMDAEQLQSTLGFREEIVREIVNLSSISAKLFVGLFAATSMFFVLRLVLQGYRLWVQLKNSYLLKRFRYVHILVSDEISIPYSTRGLFQRYIVIPESMLTHQLDLRIAIGHELQHIRQGDVEWEFFMEILKPLFFWNPAYYVWCAQVRILREYACDQIIVRRSPHGIRAYCECLLRASRSSTEQHGQLPTVALVEKSHSEKSKRSLLRKRIVAMTSDQGRKDSKLVAATVSFSLVGIVFATSILMHNPKDWSHDRLMLSTIINLERMNSLNKTMPVPSYEGNTTR